MTRYANTVVGSYPRPVQAADTMKKPTLTQGETDEMVRWAAKDQSDLGLDVITDGEAYRENMYYFYQKRVDGITFENMPRLAFGGAGFGIECPRVIGAIADPRFKLAHNWKLARDAAPSGMRVKQTVTGPHVLTRFRSTSARIFIPTIRPSAGPGRACSSRNSTRSSPLVAPTFSLMSPCGRKRLSRANGPPTFSTS